jgi:hypothetical protein
MKNKRYKTIAFLSFISIIITALVTIVVFNRNEPSVIIVNKCEGGRLGDQLISYSKAKWLSYKYNIPFRLIPFDGYKQLHLSQEPVYNTVFDFFNRAFYVLFGNTIKVNTEEQLVAARATINRPTRFVVHLGTRFYEHINSNTGSDAYDHAWLPSVLYELMVESPHFAKDLRKMLQPITPIDHIHVPKDRITVAVHIRKGGGFDPHLMSEQYFSKQFQVTKYEQLYYDPEHGDLSPYVSNNIPSFCYDIKNRLLSADKQWPDKFPPEQYYVTQLQNLSHFLGNPPLYVYIFTDDQDPVSLTKRIEKNTNKPNIIFDCRTEKNSHNTNILYDVYTMADFDCLIRSGSHFAYISQLVGNHTIIVYPLHIQWVDPKILWVNRVGVIIRTKEPPKERFGNYEDS